MTHPTRGKSVVTRLIVVVLINRRRSVNRTRKRKI